MGTNYVQAGACVSPNDEFSVVCALEASQCPDGHDYFSSRQIQQFSILNSKAQQCLEPEMTENVRVGRCTNQQIDDLICTSHSSGCAQSNEFNPSDLMCTIREDGMHDNQATFYTKCSFEQNLHVCVWDENDCTTGPIFFNSVSIASSNKNCKCEEVKTGACYHEASDTYTCAVSAEGCDSESQYVILQLLSFANAAQSIDCQLCRDPLSLPTGPPTPVPAPTPPPTPFAVPTFPPAVVSNRGPPSASVRESQGEEVLAIVIPSLLVALLLACCCGRLQPKATFSTTAIDMEENDELGHGVEDHQQNENEMIEESEFQLNRDREIT